MKRIHFAIMILLCAGLWSCSKGNQGAPTLNSSGKHPADWVVATSGGNHPASYLLSPGQCFECHGKDLAGGISKVSCFSSDRNGLGCHAIGPQGHPVNFKLPENHGSRAKSVVGGVNGLAFCKNCHGNDFRGAGSAKKDCIGCHQLTTPTTMAPHAPQPWLAGTTSHSNTDQSNAAACAQCHTAGANLRAQFKLPSYAGGTPGCFNNTLCHGVVGHSDDARQPWKNAENHGAAAKGDPSKGDGLAVCKSCHGQALTGTGSAVSCFSCHATAPHSPKPWRRTITNTTGRIHTDANPQNAAACAGCHINNQRLTTPVAVTGTPGCFDNSMCHGVTGHNDTTQFPIPAQAWKIPVNHGAKAKGSTALGTSGFTYCRNCHGDGSAQSPLFQGGRALTSCMNVIGCHITLLNNNAPHPSKPWRGTTAAGSTGHTTTDTSNATICSICHTNGANSTRAPQLLDVKGNTGCFNASMCHGITGHADTTLYPAPWSAPANHGKFARNDPTAGGINGLAYCQHCHGANFSGGNANRSCYPCHGVSAPHPRKADWTLAAGTLSHINAGLGNAGICDDCHNPTVKNLSEPYLTRLASSPAGSFKATASSGCFNASMCHGDVRNNCDTCHSTATTSPFKSMAGATAPSDSKVGAHVKHLNASTQVPAYSSNIACSECHTVPGSPAISGTHRNGSNNIDFGALAKTGSLTPVYTPATGVCSNTYCHGTTLTGGGSNKSPVWNQTNYLAGGCATCHGFPPATVRNGAAAHPASAACNGCHSHVNVAGTGFTNPALHINGTVEAAGGHAFPYPGATHRTDIGPFLNINPCGSCHNITATVGTYPVPAGTPPVCAGCHLNNWGLAFDCSDCHGDATGRPNGASFPNFQRSHFAGPHESYQCTACHPFTTGDTRHGWSNRQISTAAQVGGTSTLITSWNPGNRQCTAACHSNQAVIRTW